MAEASAQTATPTGGLHGGFIDSSRERLRSVAPLLSPREVEVCIRIMLGVTSEGIGIDLGISRNTVLTYRKRAYARLNISSQNQLFRLVM
jgi:DNA-binding CsgD family transcriptional regulator